MKAPNYPPIDYDAQFKRLIRLYFPQYMAFYMPETNLAIDWSKGYVFLDKELEEIRAADDKKADKRADFLVKVFLKDGKEQWILIHLEVQSYFETGFSKRMFVYFYRALDRFDKRIIAGALYVNNQIPRNFNQYHYEFFGTELSYKFNTFKVIDYQNREQELEENPNIFALVTLACLYIIKTKKGQNAAEQRKSLKFKLILLLYKRGYDKKEITDLFNFIRIMLTLPKQLENKWKIEVMKSTQSTTEEYPEIPEGLADFFATGLYGMTMDELLAKTTKEAQAEAQAEAKRIEEQKDLEMQKSVIRLHQKLNLDAATIADVLDKDIKWVEKILRKNA